MEQEADALKQLVTDNETAEEMANYGITSVPMNNYYYRDFHYTNLEDAVAQVKRDRIRLGLIPDS